MRPLLQSAVLSLESESEVPVECLRLQGRAEASACWTAAGHDDYLNVEMKDHGGRLIFCKKE